MANLNIFKPEFDKLATGGCLGDPDGRLAYAYLRVSGKEQGEEGRSGLPRQIEHCHLAARQNGLRIPWDMVYADDDTGFEFEHRVALTRLRREYKSASRRASVVIIEKLQRLSRNADWHQGYLRDEMKKHGITLVAYHPIGSRIESMVAGAIDQDGMEQQQQYMQEGKRKKAESGRVTARFPLDGYRFVDQHGHENTKDVRRFTYYAVNEHRAAVIRLVFDCLAYRGMSAYGVAMLLNERAATNDQFRAYRGGRWWESQIINVVRNPAYKGEFRAYRYGLRTTYERDKRTGEVKKKQRRFRRPENEQIVVRIPAIVDETTWQLANDNLRKNKRRAPANARHQYLLTGLVRCQRCGWAFHGNTPSGKGAQRYLCARHRKLSGTAERCTMPSIRLDVLEGAVWSLIAGLILSDRDVLLQAIDARYNNEGTRETLNQIGFIEAQLGALAKEEEKLRRAYLADGFTAEEFAAERKRILAEREAKCAEIARLKSQVLSPEELETKKCEALQLVAQARACVDIRNAPFEIKRHVLQSVVDEIVLNTDEGWFEVKGALGAGIHQIAEAAAPQTFTSELLQRPHLQFRVLYSIREQKILKQNVEFASSAA